MIYYKSVKIIINVLSLVKVVIKVIIRYHGFLDSIIIIWRLLFISKFRLLPCYSLSIKQKLFTDFYLQTDSLTERQNNMIKTYF